jgi:parallel beta-helix repeat protein
MSIAGLRGIWLDNSSDDTIRENSIDSVHCCILVFSSKNITIFGNSGRFLQISNSSDNTVFGNTFARGRIGRWFSTIVAIDISSSNSNVFSENSIYGGLSLQNSQNNTIAANNFTNSLHPNEGDNDIFTIGSNSSDNTVFFNHLAGMNGGIHIAGFNNLVRKNEMSNWQTGWGQDFAFLLTGSNNTIEQNTLTAWSGDTYGGAIFMAGSGNRIFHNNFNLMDYGRLSVSSAPNSWDDGYPSGGNYWNDYQGVDLYKGPLQDENGRDGIIDAPRNISLNNVDHYPLTNPWHPPPWFPIASFETAPLAPFVNETIAFDATNSYDFDGSIVSYAWDFGDGNATTVTVPEIDHFYIKPGTYNASLTVTDNEGLNNTLTRAIGVEKMPSSISISLSKETIAIRENTTVSGSIAPFRENVTVIVWDRYVGETVWNVLAEIRSDASSEYSYNWVPLQVGDYELMASWVGDYNTFPNETSAINFNCVKIATDLSITTDCPTTYLGFKIDVNGTLRDADGNGLKQKTVVLYYTPSGIEAWTPIGSDITDDLGQYLVTWIPPATGDFILRIEWLGNSTHSEVRNTTAISSLAYNDQYIFSVESNSTISALAFNTTDWALSFSATGPSGTTGYVRVTTAKTLVPNPENIRVYLDGNQTQFSILSIDDSWLLTFEYQHSSHQVQVDFDVTIIPEFSANMVLLLFSVIALTFALLNSRKIIRKKE